MEGAADRNWGGGGTGIGLGVELAGPFVFSFYHVAAFFSLLLPLD